MNGEVNRAVAQRAKAGWLRRNSALIPRSLLLEASLHTLAGAHKLYFQKETEKEE